MRLSAVFFVAAMLASVLGNSSRAMADDTYPFEAFIVADEADIYSGPGRRFYTTQKLPRGTRIEVFRRDVAGWLAIRPPEESFSWVVADHVEVGDEPNLAIVVTQTPSWIGTEIERVREHKHHLMLEPGEELSILGKRQVPQEDGESQMWLKIAPPAGEFRWVHPRDISRSKPEELQAAARQLADGRRLDRALDLDSDARNQLGMVEVPLPRREQLEEVDNEARSDVQLASAEIPLDDYEQPATERQPAGRMPSGARHAEEHGSGIQLTDLEPTTKKPLAARDMISQRFPVQPAAYQGEPSLDSASPISSDGFRPRTGSRPRASDIVTTPTSTPPTTRSRSMTPINRTTGAPALLGDAAADERVATRTSTVPAASRASEVLTSSTGSSLDDQLAAIDVELSLMLARDRREWNLIALERQTLAIVDGAENAVDRGRARLMLEKIRDFATKFKLDTLADLGVDSATGSTSKIPDAPVSAAAPATAASAATDPKYDAVGWLKPVVSRQHQAAPFAIVDSTGRPICFVSPSPGLNLNRYVNKQVGLYGRRGYLEALKTPHVTAERVISLERHLR